MGEFANEIYENLSNNQYLPYCRGPSSQLLMTRFRSSGDARRLEAVLGGESGGMVARQASCFKCLPVICRAFVDICGGATALGMGYQLAGAA